MGAAVAAMLEGMPAPRDLRLHQAAGRCVITVGSTVLFDYDAADTAMRNMAISALRQLGFPGRRVAAVLGLTESYVATLRNMALRDGSAALIRNPRPGRPSKLGEADWADAVAWRGRGLSDAEIGRRLGVANTTIGRRLGPRPAAGAPAAGPAGSPQQQELPAPQPGPGPAGAQDPCGAPETGAAGAPGTPLAVAAGPRIAGGVLSCRYAGAMLLHAFTSQADAGTVLSAASGGGGGEADGGGRRFADVALLSATSICFALGAVTIEQVKHLTAAHAGPLAGLAVLPDLRTLRPRLAAMADGCDPAGLQAMFAAAMLAAEPVTSGVYYVDDHFVAYTGAKPVGKGWNNKRGRAEKGHADTHVTAHDGRAVCFVTGEPSGLAVTLPPALAELRKAAGPGAKIMLGFDRGGAYPQVFRHCREAGADWVTYRRAPLAVPAGLPVLTTITVGGKQRQVTWAEETVQLKDYGAARQITLFEHGQVALQILTSDTVACPAQILSWLKSRWREENFLKYASANYGIDAICDYIADVQANTRITDNPARKTAAAAARQAEKALTTAREELAVLLADPAIAAAAKNTRLIPAAQKKITTAGRQLAAAEAARDKTPARLPANVIDPEAQRALLRTSRRGLQMVLRLLACNAEHWVASHLNAYLRDDDEYRAITRQTIIRGLAGTITYTPAAITVQLDQPDAPRVTRALSLLLEEINATPPSMPGDPRPITYQMATLTPAFNN
jgi:transposase-like protein